VEKKGKNKIIITIGEKAQTFLLLIDSIGMERSGEFFGVSYNTTKAQ